MEKFDPRHYYSKEGVAETYDDMRFVNSAGRTIDLIQKNIILKSFLDKNSKRRILEIGTGTGRFSLMFSSNGHKVVGLDYSKNMISIAFKKTKNLNLNKNLQFVVGDALNPPFKEGSFDSIISIHVLMHIQNWEDMISNMTKLLTPKGLVLIQIPNLFSFSYFGKVLRKFARLFGLRVQWAETEPQLFTKKKIVNVFRKCGLEITHTEMSFFIPPTIYRTVPNFMLPFVYKIDKMCLCTPLKNFASDRMIEAVLNE